MNSEPQDRLERVLAALPYPGEEEAALRARLQRARLPERVMEGIEEGEAPAPARGAPWPGPSSPCSTWPCWPAWGRTAPSCRTTSGPARTWPGSSSFSSAWPCWAG